MIPARSHRSLLTGLAFLSLALAWLWMWRLSAQAPWYHNANMDVHMVANALSLNAGSALGLVEQPASTSVFALGLDLRLRHDTGQREIWTLKRFARSADPLAELAALIAAGRSHSRMMVILIILLSAGFAGHVTRRFEPACLTAILLSGCSGLLYHGLLLRPELLGAAFGLLAFYAVWLAFSSVHATGRTLWLVLAGAALGLSVFSHLPSSLHLLAVFAWCCGAPLCPAAGGSPPRPSRTWLVAAGLASSLACLPILHHVTHLLDAESAGRMRGLAMLAATLPLFAFSGPGGRIWTYLVDRLSDLALLIAGLLMACASWFGLLHFALSPAGATEHLARLLNTVLHVDSSIRLLLHPAETHRLREAIRFVMDAPSLFSSTALLVAALAFFPRIQTRYRAFVGLLFAHALAMLVALSLRRHSAESSLYIEVPLLLAWGIALGTLHEWWREQAAETERRWPVALTLTAAVILALTAPLALRSKYSPSPGRVPVDDGFLVTFLYDHDVHPRAYLDAMKSRYPTRQVFTEALNRFLTAPGSQPGGRQP